MVFTGEDKDMIQRVKQWARTNAPNDYFYGAPYSYFQSALTANFINKQDYSTAEQYFGKLWTYRGD